VEHTDLSSDLSSIFPHAAGDCFAHVPPQGHVFADDFHFLLRFSRVLHSSHPYIRPSSLWTPRTPISACSFFFSARTESAESVFLLRFSSSRARLGVGKSSEGSAIHQFCFSQYGEGSLRWKPVLFLQPPVPRLEFSQFLAMLSWWLLRLCTGSVR
jgi:hypothetical protein